MGATMLAFSEDQPRMDDGMWDDGSGMGAVADVESGGAWTAEIETGHVIDPSGKLIGSYPGGKESVGFIGPEQRASLKDATFTHNHPKGGTFSPEDIAFAAWGNVREMRAFGMKDSKKVIYSMKRPAKGWPDGLKVQASFRLADEKARKLLVPQVASGKLTLSEAMDMAKEKNWAFVEKKYGLKIVRHHP